MNSIKTYSLLPIIVFGSFFSIPNPSGVGMFIFTICYLSLIVFLFFIKIIQYKITKKEIIVIMYFLLLLVFMIVNYYIAIINNIDEGIWFKRTMHLMFIPIYYLIFSSYCKNRLCKRSELIKVIEEYFIVMAIIESFLVYVSFFINDTVDERATAINGMIVYSVLIVVGSYYALKKYNDKKEYKYFLIYIFSFFAILLTGSRILLLSELVLILIVLVKITKKNLYFIFFIIAILAILLNFKDNLIIFDRFDMEDTKNFITIQGKINEVIQLYNFFISYPVFGVGYGKEFDTYVDIAMFTYSHNWLMFNLGYGGIIGFILALFPLVVFFIKTERSNIILIIAIIIFYFSSTTYTNIKHSMLMAFFLLYFNIQNKMKI